MVVFAWLKLGESQVLHYHLCNKNLSGHIFSLLCKWRSMFVFGHRWFKFILGGTKPLNDANHKLGRTKYIGCSPARQWLSCLTKFENQISDAISDDVNVECPWATPNRNMPIHCCDYSKQATFRPGLRSI